MFWRLHKAIFGEQIEKAVEIIEQFGDSYQLVEGTPSQLPEAPTLFGNEAVLAITTLQDANRLMRKEYPGTPWLFFNNTSYKVSYWLPRIGSNINVLNREPLFLPMGLLKKISSLQLNRIIEKDKKLFIKPDSGNKIFTGFSIKNDEFFVENVKEQIMFSYVEDEDMCVISEHKDIEDIEWRFWIAEGEIIAYSPYSWKNDPAFFKCPEKILEQAQAMAKNSWQPDYIYVADFCTTLTGEAMLIEINAASTSGIYNAPLEKLLSGFRKTCLREFDCSIYD